MKTLKAGIAAVLAAAGLAFAAAPAGAAVSWQWYDVDRDSCRYELAIWPVSGHQEVWTDADNDCRLDTRMWIAQEAGRWVWWASFDMNENGTPEAYMYDNDASRPGWEWVYSNGAWRYIGAASYSAGGNALYSGLIGADRSGTLILYYTYVREMHALLSS